MTKTNSPVTTVGKTRAPDYCTEDALEDLRLNRTHTMPPGMRGAFVATKLPRLGEEHLAATGETTTHELGTHGNETRSFILTCLHSPLLRRIGGIAIGVLLLGGLAAWLLAAPRNMGQVEASNPTPPKEPAPPTKVVSVPKPSFPVTERVAAPSVSSTVPRPFAPAPKVIEKVAKKTASKKAPTPSVQAAADPDEPIFKIR